MAKPSKKIIIVVVLVVVIAVIVALLNISPKAVYTAPTADTATTTSALAIDSDNDGLKDWEEALWKTDPHNPDTDGDGTPDGLEIKLGRNPLIPGPNDKLDTETVDSKVNSQTEKDLSETDKFSRELFVKIIAASQADNPPTETDFQNFLNGTIKNQVDTQKVKTYIAGDFQVDIEETPEKIKAYGNAIATILKTPPPQKLTYEIDVVDKADADKNPAELKKLDGNIAAYNLIVTKLLGLTVPKSALEIHLALANAASAMSWSITGLQYILTDPVKAVPGVASYSDNFQNFFTALHAFRGYFDNGNITFDPTDAGYHFFDGL